jgi:hypothetical protein
MVACDTYDGVVLARMIALPDFLPARPNLLGCRFVPA